MAKSRSGMVTSDILPLAINIFPGKKKSLLSILVSIQCNSSQYLPGFGKENILYITIAGNLSASK